MPNKIYCEECGSKLVWKPARKFDPYTGEQKQEQVCPNVHCPNGCSVQGHEMKFPYWRCKRCGYVPEDHG